VLDLALGDWPGGGTDEAVVHVEIGKVPDLKGLPLKAAIQRVVMAGGVPKIEALGGSPEGAFLVMGQSPEPGGSLEYGKPVKIKLREP